MTWGEKRTKIFEVRTVSEKSGPYRQHVFSAKRHVGFSVGVSPCAGGRNFQKNAS